MAVEMVIGAGYASGSAMQSPYADGGFESAEVTAWYTEYEFVLHYSHNFTNGSGGNRTVREVGIGNVGGGIYSRVVLDIDAMANFCVVPDGALVSIEWYRDLRTTDPGAVRASIDTSSFTNTSPINYNGVTLPNASILSISHAFGSTEWKFRCHTYEYGDILALNIYAGPISTGTSILGLIYFVSAYRAGTLKIKNMATRAYIVYDRCYIKGPIQIEPFGDGYWFDISIVQSAYNEA